MQRAGWSSAGSQVPNADRRKEQAMSSEWTNPWADGRDSSPIIRRPAGPRVKPARGRSRSREAEVRPWLVIGVVLLAFPVITCFGGLVVAQQHGLVGFVVALMASAWAALPSMICLATHSITTAIREGE